MNCIKKAVLPLLLLCVINISFKANAKIDTIYVDDFFFAPSGLAVDIGDTIRWVWASSFSHTSTSLMIPAGAASWNSPVMSGTGTYDYIPTVLGAYDYWCAVHTVGMTGSFTVVEPPIDIRKCANLFFSEYYEGSSWNKALEIYNQLNTLKKNYLLLNSDIVLFTPIAPKLFIISIA